MAEKLRRPNSKEELSDLEISSEKLQSLEKGLEKEAKEAEAKHTVEKQKAKQEMEKVIDDVEKGPKSTVAVKNRISAHKGIKKQEYRSTMRRVESRLPAYQRAFSKIIHNKAVDSAANVVGKTVARPSGLLGGALASFVGLLVIYLNARRVGFEYPVGTTFLFFVSIGWLVGILVEYIYGAVKRITKS